MEIWADFKTAVGEELSFSGDREKYQAFIARQIRFAALDLQREVKQYRVGHVSRYDARSISPKGNAGAVILPDGVQIDAVYIEPNRAYASSVADAVSSRIEIDSPPLTGAVALTVEAWVRGIAGEAIRISTDNGEFASTVIAASDTWESHTLTLNIADASLCSSLYFGYGDGTYCSIDWSEALIRSATFTQYLLLGEDAIDTLYTTKKLARYSWERRNELVTGDHSSGRAPGYYAHNSTHLWAYPCGQAALDAGAVITLEMTGRKLTFADTDKTPFDELAINAAALYVRYKLLKHIDLFNEGWKVQTDYEKERALIIADKNASS